MNGSRLKYSFFISAALLLGIMLFTSRDAGITCDEVLHYNHSQAVLKYYETHGEDKSALNTPVTHLRYYGQSYDNFVSLLIKVFDIEDVYMFRHLMSSLAGWLAIFITALFAVWLSGYKNGLLVILLFAVTPAFIGHSHNNLKDVPFALAYISSIYFTIRFVTANKSSIPDAVFLTLSLAFGISIRAGGLLLVCYLFFFFFLVYLLRFLRNDKPGIREILMKFSMITGISIVAWALSIIFWPYALQRPVVNVIESYKVMAHFPDTFRQLFEGKFEWSDFMPWYYLPKSMLITIPLVVFAGMILFIAFHRYYTTENSLIYGFVIFAVLFPMFFVIFEKSNLYSSWRQFLFLYPPVVLLSGAGFNHFFERINQKYLKWIGVAALVILSVHPVKFMIRNHPYYYLYYNQLAGGFRGAYTNYETDYYYTSQTEASEWLKDYLKDKNVMEIVKVKATYSVVWQFRNFTGIETSWFRYEERSQSDWDYAIVVNRYIPRNELLNGSWPPENTIHTINVEGLPVCAVLKRRTKDDYYGYKALSEGKNKEAIEYFEKAVRTDDKDEMIFYNFAAALYKEGQHIKADSALKKCLELNPEFEPALMYLGNIALAQKKDEEAIGYYEKLISTDRKYFEAYVELSGLLKDRDLKRSRNLLRTCLEMNPGYKPAILAMADSYRETDPGVAEKYDNLAKTLE